MRLPKKKTAPYHVSPARNCATRLPTRSRCSSGATCVPLGTGTSSLFGKPFRHLLGQPIRREGVAHAGHHQHRNIDRGEKIVGRIVARSLEHPQEEQQIHVRHMLEVRHEIGGIEQVLVHLTAGQGNAQRGLYGDPAPDAAHQAGRDSTTRSNLGRTRASRSLPWKVCVTRPLLPQRSTRPRIFSGRWRYASSTT